MAVIITDMDMRKACLDEKALICPLYDRCYRKGISVGYSLPNNCPLKSADEMIAEIDKIAYTRILTTNPFAQDNLKIVGYDSLMKVIHKYCDKGAEQ